jgi:hypothetical protein
MGKHRSAQLVDAGERQLHLCLDAHHLDDAEPRRLPRGVSQKRCLPDPRRTAEHHDGTLPAATLGEHPVEELTLACSAQQHWRRRGGHDA